MSAIGLERELGLFTRSYDFFTREEEVELWEAMRAGCEASKEKLVLSMIPMVRSIAVKTYHGPRIAKCDLESCMLLQLVEVLTRFDPSHGRLSTIARIAMQRAAWNFVAREKQRNGWANLASEVSVDDESRSLVDDADSRSTELAKVRALLPLLTDYEQLIIQKRYFEGWTLQEVATLDGRTRESVRQHEAKALKKLREAMT